MGGGRTPLPFTGRKSPRHTPPRLRHVIQPDARRGQDCFHPRAFPLFHEQSALRVAHPHTIERARDAERLGQLGWPITPDLALSSRPAFGNPLQAFQRLHRADQSGGGHTLRSGDEVEAPVHPVGEIHVCHPRGTKHDGVALGLPGVRVAAQVLHSRGRLPSR